MLNKEQEEAELRYLFGEALSEYLQGYSYEQGPAAFDTLETASLNLGDDIPRQGFKTGGSISPGDLMGGLDPNISAIAGLGINIATKSNPASIALSGVNVAVTALTGKSITDHLGFTDPTGVLGPLGFKGDITYGSYPTGLEEDTPPGTTTSLAGRKAAFAATGSTNPGAIAPSIKGAEGQQFGYSDTSVTAPSSTASTPGDYPEGIESDVTSSTSSTDVATGDTSGGADAASGDVSSGDVSGEEGSGGEYSGGAKEGGQIKGYQEGDLVAPEQTETQLDDLGLGPTGLVNDPDGEARTGVADDLEMELEEDSYVLNADTVNLVGIRDLNTMVKDAINVALESGIKLPREVDPTKKVPIRISRNEFVIPAPLTNVIGKENLEKMNNRGLREREQRENEEAPVQTAAAPSPQEDLLAQIKPVA